MSKSWQSLFPVLTPSKIIDTFKEQGGKDQGYFLRLFEVESVNGNLSGDEGIFSTSLFLQNHETNLHPVSDLSGICFDGSSQCEAAIVKAGWNKPSRPWFKHYAKPLMRYDGRKAVKVYLSNNLKNTDLFKDLESKHQVSVMAANSIRHDPGALWRFLGLSQEGKVNICDCDNIGDETDISEMMVESGLRWWRNGHHGDYVIDFNDDDSLFYHPVSASSFGFSGPIFSREEIQWLLAGFTWMACNGLLQTHTYHPTLERVIPIFGANPWSYGFDELFCTLVLYPLMIAEGCISILPHPDHATAIGLLDRKNTRANSKNKIIEYEELWEESVMKREHEKD